MEASEGKRPLWQCRVKCGAVAGREDRVRSMFCIPNESRAHAGLWSASSECIKSVPRSKGPAFIQAHVSVAERLWRASRRSVKSGDRSRWFFLFSCHFSPKFFFGDFLGRRRMNTVHNWNDPPRVACAQYVTTRNVRADDTCDQRTG